MPRITWVDNIKEWIGKIYRECVEAAEKKQE